MFDPDYVFNCIKLFKFIRARALFTTLTILHFPWHFCWLRAPSFSSMISLNIRISWKKGKYYGIRILGFLLHYYSADPLPCSLRLSSSLFLRANDVFNATTKDSGVERNLDSVVCCHGSYVLEESVFWGSSSIAGSVSKFRAPMGFNMTILEVWRH